MVDRCVRPARFGDLKIAELHSFADALQNAYGAVTSLRLVDVKERIHCTFLIGKSCVAPLRPITVPRLELSAAVLAAQLDRTIQWSFKNWNNICAGRRRSEVPLKYEWDSTRFEPGWSSFCESLVRLYSSSSGSLSVVTVTRSDLLAIWGLPNNPERFLVTSSWHLQSSFESAQENMISAGKAELLIWLKGVNFCGVIFCVFFSASSSAHLAKHFDWDREELEKNWKWEPLNLHQRIADKCRNLNKTKKKALRHY